MRFALLSFVGASLVSSVYPGVRSLLDQPALSSSFSSITDSSSSSSLSSSPISSSETSFSSDSSSPKTLQTTAGPVLVSVPTKKLGSWGSRANPAVQRAWKARVEEEEDQDDKQAPAQAILSSAPKESSAFASDLTSAKLTPSRDAKKEEEEDEADDETTRLHAEIMLKGVEAAKTLWKTIQTTNGPEMVPSSTGSPLTSWKHEATPPLSLPSDPTVDTVQSAKPAEDDELEEEAEEAKTPLKKLNKNENDEEDAPVKPRKKEENRSLKGRENARDEEVPVRPNKRARNTKGKRKKGKSDEEVPAEPDKRSQGTTQGADGEPSTSQFSPLLPPPSAAISSEAASSPLSDASPVISSDSSSFSSPVSSKASSDRSPIDSSVDSSTTTDTTTKSVLNDASFSSSSPPSSSDLGVKTSQSSSSTASQTGSLSDTSSSSPSTSSPSEISSSSADSQSSSDLGSASTLASPAKLSDSSSLSLPSSTSIPSSSASTLASDAPPSIFSSSSASAPITSSSSDRSTSLPSRFASTPEVPATTSGSTQEGSSEKTSSATSSTFASSFNTPLSTPMPSSVIGTTSSSTSVAKVEEEGDDDDTPATAPSTTATATTIESGNKDTSTTAESPATATATTPPVTTSPVDSSTTSLVPPPPPAAAPSVKEGKSSALTQDNDDEADDDNDEDDEPSTKPAAITTPPATFSLSKPFSPEPDLNAASGPIISDADAQVKLPPSAATTPATAKTDFLATPADSVATPVDSLATPVDSLATPVDSLATTPATTSSSKSSPVSDLDDSLATTPATTSHSTTPKSTATSSSTSSSKFGESSPVSDLDDSLATTSATTTPKSTATSSTSSSKFGESSPVSDFDKDDADDEDELFVKPAGQKTGESSSNSPKLGEQNGPKLGESKSSGMNDDTMDKTVSEKATGEPDEEEDDVVKTPQKPSIPSPPAVKTDDASSTPAAKSNAYVAVRLGVVFKLSVLELDLKPPRLWEMLNADLATALKTQPQRFEMSQFSDNRHLEFQIVPSSNAEASAPLLAEQLATILEGKDTPTGILSQIEAIEKTETVSACEDGSFAKVCGARLESKGSNWVYYLGGLLIVGVVGYYFKQRRGPGSTKTVNGAKFARVKSDEEDILPPPPRVSSVGESASEFVERVLGKLGIPSYGMAKYTNMLKDRHLHTLEQLRGMDDADWKAVGLPEVIETGLKEALTGRPAVPTREVRSSGGMELTRQKPAPSRVERVEESGRGSEGHSRVPPAIETEASNPTDAWDLDMPDEEAPSPVSAKGHVASNKKAAMVIPEEKDPEAPSADSELTSDKPVPPKTRPKPKAAANKSKTSQKKASEVQEEGDGWMDMDDF